MHLRDISSDKQFEETVFEHVGFHHVGILVWNSGRRSRRIQK